MTTTTTTAAMTRDTSPADHVPPFDLSGLEESLVDDELDADDMDDMADDDADGADEWSALRRVRAALIRRPECRHSDEIDAIVAYVDTIGACRHFDAHTRRRLARAFVLAEIEARDTRVLARGERLDAFCVLACGSLRVCDGASERLLFVGDEFGGGHEPNGEQLTEMWTNEDFVWVFCIPHVVYGEITSERLPFRELTDDASGRTIEVRTNQNALIRATRDRLYDLLFECSSVDANDATQRTTSSATNGETFIDDFLLTFRIWDDASDDQSDVVDGEPPDADERADDDRSDDAAVRLMRRLVGAMSSSQTSAIQTSTRVVLQWIENHFNDFHGNAQMMALLARFEEQLQRARDFRLHLKLYYLALSAKSRDRRVTLNRNHSDDAPPFVLIGGYESRAALFVEHVSAGDDCGVARGDRILAINGNDVTNHVSITRANQLLTASSVVSLVVRFDPSAFHALKHVIGENAKQHKPKTGGDATSATTPPPPISPPLPVTAFTPPTTNGHVSAHNQNARQKWSSLHALNAFVTRLLPKAVQALSLSAGGLAGHPLGASHASLAADHVLHVLKVYFEREFRFLVVRRETTAREVVQLALREFALSTPSSSSRDYALYEIQASRASATSAVRRLADTASDLVSNLALNSRLYLKHVTQTVTHSDAIAKEIARENPPLSLTTLDGAAVAMEISRADFERFAAIEAQQFVYDLMDSRPERRRELIEFESVSNRQMFWTINAVLRERVLNARVRVVKQFIKVASECRALNNFNTLFAILSGLDHGAVHRLRATWDRIPAKHVRQLHALQQLMDPSRNMFEYRQAVARAAPPVIPFFPLVKKDLAFVALANQTRVDALVNWEKMALLGAKIRQLMLFSANACPPQYVARAATSAQSQPSVTCKRVWDATVMAKRVQKYLSETMADIEMDEQTLIAKSMACEAPPPLTTGSAPSSSLTTGTSRSSIAANSLHSQSSSSPTPSFASCSTNSSSQMSFRQRFGAESPQQLRKLLALSSSPSTPTTPPFAALRPPTSSSDDHQCASQHSAATLLSTRMTSLPVESSSVTSLRRLEQLQQLSRFRDQWRRPLPDYHTTMQRRAGLQMALGGGRHAAAQQHVTDGAGNARATHEHIV